MPSYKECTSQQQALFACKRALGLLPQQCYPVNGYKNECDQAEFQYKMCLASVASPRDAEILYVSRKATRQEKVDANLRLQKKLRPFNVPCTP
jgi:hypothetical protein